MRTAPTPPRTAARTLGAYVALTKPRIISLLLVTTVPAMILAEGGLPSIGLIAATLVGGTIAAAGANALNQYYDRDIDARMGRTATRPIPSGRVSPAAAQRFGLVLGALSFVFLAATTNLLAAMLAVSAIGFYVLVYTLWLKRTSPQNIVIGGAAGAVPVLVGWAAVTGSLALPAWILFAVIFAWTPPHFWALSIKYKDDYAAAGVPMMPVVSGEKHTALHILAYTGQLVALTLVLYPVARLGTVYLLACVVLGAIFTSRAVALWREPTVPRAMSVFSFSIPYLGLLFLALAADVLISA